ncbi:cutinase family protein [Mycolicibacterium mengxianglii]|uniref:cutinase family protein n=1 Tax=Mycolicibacterium mengxianglii TaxID=2736649 RepID=UPI0018D1EF4F|nr:cutinase family protein [Mycolicibacterium mengxianglii]
MSTFRRLLCTSAAIAATLFAVLAAAPGAAQAAPTGCPDVEVIFARGTFEPAGVGRTGDAFVNSLRNRLADKSVEVYPVAYPASLDFGRAADGVIDASNRVQDIANRCPATEIVLGGYSQGAAVNAYVTADSVPAGYALPTGLSGPMPAAVADHVAAVALFGKPSNGILNLLAREAPPIVIGAPYAGKTIDLCAPADPVCQAGSLDRGAHSLYAVNGMTDQAADFVARQLQTV